MKNIKIIPILLLSLLSSLTIWADDVTATVLNERGSNTGDGRIFLTITGGVGPFSFIWSGPNGFSSTSQDIYGLHAGIYSVTVSDALCGNAVLENLEVKACFFQQTNEIGAVCNGNNGYAKISLQNGVAPYYYKWSNPVSVRTTNENVIELTNLNAGNYSIIVGDASGCQFRLPIVIENAPSVGINLISTEASCPYNPDGAISTSVSGGTSPFKFSWSNGTTSQQLYNVSSGTHTLTITDSKNCKTESSFNVGIFPSTTQPTTTPCGYISYCKGIGTQSDGDYPLRQQNDNSSCTIKHICPTTNEVAYTTAAPIYTRTGSDCSVEYYCSLTGETFYTDYGSTYWQPNYACHCCTQDLICSLTGQSIGYTACGFYLEYDKNPQCCGIIWMICNCTYQRAVYMRESGCGEAPDCTGDYFKGGENQSDKLTKNAFKSDGYIYYIDPKTKKHHAFTIEDIASKKYKSEFPDMFDVNLNEKVKFNGDSVTLISMLKPQSFSFTVNPNPFEATATISLFIPNESFDKTGYLSVNNQLGQTVETYQYDDLKVGENQLKPDLSRLKSGMYFISIRVNGKIETTKVYKN